MLPRIKFPIEPLVNEILDQFPKEVWGSSTTTFLDPAIAGGQFVREIERRLLANGHSKENISQRVVGFDIYEHQIRYAVNRYKLIGKYNAKKFQEQDLKHMNFNVIVGNPPYNNSESGANSDAKNTSGGSLYFKFIESALSFKPAEMSFVVPASWMQNDRLRTLMVEAGLKSVTSVDPAYFPSVGIRSGITTFYIKKGYTGTITLTKGDVVYNVDRDAVLSFDDPKKFDIVAKLQQSDNLSKHLKLGNYTVKKGTKGSIERLLDNDDSYSATQDSVYKTKVMIYTGGSRKPADYVYSKINLANDKFGLAIPNASDKHILGGVRIIEPGVGVSDRLKVVYFDTENQAKNALDYLNSKLLRFVIRTTKHNDTVNHNKNSFSNIPMLDFTRAWTDTELYSKFNLTSDQIALVDQLAK